jgi:nitrate reductase NapE component
MDKNKLAEMHKREEYNYQGFAAFVLIISPVVFAGAVLGLYKLAEWLIQIGG